MMSPDPLRSAMSNGTGDNTSLAVPYVNQYRSGQQRVLEQVQTIKRTKSRHSTARNGTGTLSPTSPTYDSVFTYSHKSLPITANGESSPVGNGFSKRTIGSEKNANRHTVRTAKGSVGQWAAVQSSHNISRGYNGNGATVATGTLGGGTMGRANTSRSEPDLGRRFTRPRQAGPPGSQKLLSNRSSVFLSERTVTSGGQHASNDYRPQPQYQPQPQPQSQYQVRTQSQYQPQPQLQYQSNGRSQYPSKSQSFYQGKGQSQSQYQGQGQSQYQGQGQNQYQANGQSQHQATVLPPPQSFMNGTVKGKQSSHYVTTTTQTQRGQSQHGQTVVDSGIKTMVDSGLNVPADLTMKDAVAWLSSPDQQQQHCGASFIQHSTFVEDKAKQEVHQLSGIPPLAALLRSPNPQIAQTASAALRNLSFKDTPNKAELFRCGGVEEVVALLRESDSADTQKQLTGLLWNMSSVENLRPDLLKSTLPALMEKVILPYTTGPDRSSNTDPEIFYHATGCLRNFSSGNVSIRQSMRKCRGLVDSLVSYVEECVEAQRPDDKAVENCVCVLHNLTFQLVAEAPALFSRISALGRVTSTPEGDTGPIGCFSPQSSKVLEAERHFDYPTVEEKNPTGAGWLIHSQTLRSYLELLSSSQKDDTLEASCGALQNLTAQPGIVSNVISQTVVKKLNGLTVLAPLLRTPKINLQRNTVALVANLAKNPSLTNAIARKALPELYGILEEGTEGTESDDTLSMACQTAHLLTLKEQDMGRPLLKNNLIHSLNHLSKDDHFPKSSKAAALLLYSLWSDKELQGSLKKKGLSKSSFVNKETIAAHRSVQVVD